MLWWAVETVGHSLQTLNNKLDLLMHRTGQDLFSVSVFVLKQWSHAQTDFVSNATLNTYLPICIPALLGKRLSEKLTYCNPLRGHVNYRNTLETQTSN